MTKPTRILLRASSLGMTVALMGAGSARAQVVGAQVPDTTAAAEAQAPATEAPAPVLAAQVIARSDSLDALLDERDALLAADGRIAAVDSALTRSAATIASLATRTDSTSLGSASFRVFDDLSNRWRALAEELQGRQATVDRRSREVDSISTRLDQDRSTWVATRDSVGARDYPEAVRAQVDAVIVRIDESRTRARARLDELLDVATRMSAQQSRARDAIQMLESVEAERRQQLLSPEQPPLWRAFGPAPDTGSLTASLRAAWRNDWDVLKTFASQERDVIAFRLVLLVLFAVALTLLHARLGAQAEADPELASAMALLARPLSGAFLLFLLSGRLLHGSLPQVYRDVNALLLMIPLARMVPVLVPAVSRTAAYGLIGLFTALLIESFFLLPPITARLLSLGENVVVLGGLAWFARSEAARAIGRGRWSAALTFYLQVGMALLVGSLLANLFGLIDLGELLSWGVVVGLISGFLAMAAVILIRATFRVVLRQPFARASAAVRRAPNVIARRFDAVLTFAFVVWWISFMLGIFRIRDIVIERAMQIVSASLTLGSIHISLGDVLAFVLVVWGSMQVSRFVRFVLSEDVLPRVHLPRGVPRAITTITNYVVLGVGFLFATAAAGIDLSQMALLVGAFGVGIGLGLQSIVNNFVSGLILLFERPIQVGDTIQIDTILGTAERIGIRASVVRTFDGAEFIVPNAELVAGRVINWSLSDRRRRFELNVGVAYGADAQKAMEILKRVASEHDAVLSDPAPVVRFSAFGDSALELKLYAWATLDDWLDVESDLHVRVNEALRDARIEIPFPQRDLHVRSVDETASRALGGAGAPAGALDAT